MFELALCIAQIEYRDYIKVIDLLNEKNYYEKISTILNEKKAIKIKNVIDKIDDYIYEMKKNEISFISLKDEKFPKKLLDVEQPCYGFFYKGNIDLINTFSISIIGSRKPTTYGTYVANKFSSELVKYGITIISGLASGIDTIAHKGATNNNGKTIAVLGTAIDNIYPSNNKKYSEEMLSKGNLIISEFPLGSKTYPYNFVQRNRLISGLSSGLLVVEASEKSGTLTTVDFALEQGINIFSVPGNINSLNSLGTNKLIKLGAKITTQVEDILEEYDITAVDLSDKEIENESLTEDEKNICLLLKEKGVLNYEEILMFTNFNIKYIIGLLSVLEVKGIIKDLGNNSYSLK